MFLSHGSKARLDRGRLRLPEDGSQLWMHTKFSEAIEVFERSKDAFKVDDGREIEFSDYSIFELETDFVPFQRCGFDDIL